MGERHGWLFEPTFNRSIKIRQANPRITSDAGALLLRQHIYGLALGYAHQDDADTLARDPAFKLAGRPKTGKNQPSVLGE